MVLADAIVGMVEVARNSGVEVAIAGVLVAVTDGVEVALVDVAVSGMPLTIPALGCGNDCMIESQLCPEAATTA